MRISLLQLALLPIAIGVLLLGVLIVRRSPEGDLARPLKFLHWGFWGSVFSSALPIGVDWLFATDAGPFLPSVVSYLFMAVFYVFACFYWAALGVLAQRTGRSWVLWVVAGLATLAVGFFVSYLLMTSRARRELSGPAARGTPSRSSRGSA